MQELEHIVKELKARNAASSAQDMDPPVDTPRFERSVSVGVKAEPPLTAGAEVRRASAIRAAMEAAAPPIPKEPGAAMDDGAAPKVRMPRVSEPLRAERGAEASAAAVAQTSLRAERAGSAQAAPKAMVAARKDVPVETAAGSGSGAGAGSKRPGRKLFADTPRARRTGGAGGGAAGGGAGGSGGSGGADDNGRERRVMPAWINGVGAVAAVALILGVGLWTYRLGQRDAMEVPIVRALEGPARVQPQDPGGAQIAHQGLAVNEVLDGGGVASVAEIVQTAPGDEGAQPEDKAAGALVGLAEISKPSRRPLSNVGSAETAEVRAAVAIDDVLAIAHQKVADAKLAGEAQSDAAERDAIDAIVSAIASREGTERPPLPQVGAGGEATADAVQAAERKAAEALEEVKVAMVKPEAQADVSSGQADVSAFQVSDGSVVGGTGAAVSRPPQGVTASLPAGTPIGTDADGSVVVAQAPEPLATEPEIEAVPEPVLVAAVALVPSPPAGEGSAYAPVTQAQPKARPRGLAAQMRVAVDQAVGTAPAPAATPEPAPVRTADVSEVSGASDAIPLPAGTRMIQIGAFDSPEVAEQQWSRFSSLHSDLLGAKSHYIQRTNNSGRVFYRLRVAGYQSKEDTRAACSALSARGLPCISVTLR